MSRAPRIYFYRGLSSALPSADIRAFTLECSRDFNKFFITDIPTVQERIDTWKDHLGWIQPHYAIKANDSDWLLTRLHQNNFSFDVATSAEMEKCVKLGIPTSQLIYSHAVKTEADLREAVRLGVRLTVFDAVSELQKISRIWGPNAQVLMRIKVEDDGAQVSFSHRFGAEKYEWFELFETLKSLGLTLRGVSFHVGSGIEGEKAAVYAKAIDRAKWALESARDYGFSNVNILNIGGGFGAKEDMAAVGSVLSRFREELSDYKWIAEPGRYFAAFSQTVVTQALLVKPARKERVQQITVNDGIYGSFSCIPFDHSGLLRSNDFPVDVEGLPYNDVVPTQVFGPSCDGYDILSQNLPVPADIEVGDFLAFAGMGAYTQVSASTFNGVPLSNAILYNPTPISSFSDSSNVDRVDLGNQVNERKDGLFKRYLAWLS